VLPEGIDVDLFPEEKAMSSILRLALDCQAADQRGDKAAGERAWTKALAETQNRPDLLESLGQMAMRWQAPDRAEAALWKLAETPSMPRWAIDFLVTAAERQGDSGQRYRAVRLLRRADPQNVSIRNEYVRLALLTRQDAEMPERQARELYESDPRNPDFVATYALALQQQRKTDRAIEVLEGLPLEHLRRPRPAFYYGMVLTAAGKGDKAREYLQLGAQFPAMAEERALLANAKENTGSDKR
jgi:hypothetical protein